MVSSCIATGAESKGDHTVTLIRNHLARREKIRTLTRPTAGSLRTRPRAVVKVLPRSGIKSYRSGVTILRKHGVISNTNINQCPNDSQDRCQGCLRAKSWIHRLQAIFSRPWFGESTGGEVWRPACGQQKRQGYRRFADDGNRDRAPIQFRTPCQANVEPFSSIYCPNRGSNPADMWHRGQHTNSPRNSWTLRRTINVWILRKFTVIPQAQAQGRYVWRARPFVGKGWDRSKFMYILKLEKEIVEYAA